MFENKIRFTCIDPNFVDIWPHPKPATKFITDAYKKLERYSGGNLLKGTVKTCMPFLDSMTAGYIIPFDQDYLIDAVENDFVVIPSTKKEEDTGEHPNTQLPTEWHKGAGEKAGKFINKWLIETPPGYSCLFIHPMNRVEERYKIIEGIVDTDSYMNTIHFPFILKEWNKQTLLKKGDPMVQVVPFKRESWKMWSGFTFEKEHSKTLNRLNSEWSDRYKKYWWKKKGFK